MHAYEELDAWLLAFPGAVKDYKAEWGWWRYQVGGKLFAAIVHPASKYDPAYADKDLLTIKCDPLLAPLLRSQYPQILPAFYSDKRCWNSVDLNGGLPAEMLRGLCEDSYRLVFEKLTKKMQKEITEAAQ